LQKYKKYFNYFPLSAEDKSSGKIFLCRCKAAGIWLNIDLTLFYLDTKKEAKAKP